METLRQSLGVSSLDHTFGNFEHLPGTDRAYTAFFAMANRDDARPFLLCYGGVGNGKTYLCEALALALRKKGRYARVVTMARVMSVLKHSMQADSGMLSLDDILNNYCKAPHLILDDVGMGGSGSAWEFGQLEEIVCYRYRERLMTVLTTNRDLKELPERIVSRFYDPEVGFVVLNEGADFRRKVRED